MKHLFVNSKCLKGYLLVILFAASNFLSAQPGAGVGKPLNICSTIFDEFAPSISADGKTLIFQSNKDGEYKLYESKLQANGLWSEPVPIRSVNEYGKKNDLVGGPNISYDGNRLYFCASYAGGWGDIDLYYCERTEQGWSAPINVGKPVNTRDYEGFPSVSSDGKRMYFTRFTKELSDGTNCFKIMVTEKDKKGNWQEPRELPAPINIDCDKAPRIMPDGKTIVFASIREGGKGKFDLYTSKLNEAGEWEVPIPMEFVNTPDQEQYATVPASGDKIYYHSNNNIIEMIIPFKYRQNKNVTLQGYITDYDTKQPLEAEVTVIDASTSQKLSTQPNNAADGRYTVVLTAGKKYEVVFTRPGYSIYSETFDLTELNDYKEFETNVQLFTKIEYELSIMDKELFFHVDAQISVKNAKTKEPVTLPHVVNDKGNKVYTIPIGQKLQFEIKAKGYASYIFSLDLTGEVKYKFLEKEVDMLPNTKPFDFSVSDNQTGEPLAVDVIITNLDLDEQIVAQAYVTRDGKFSINLREGHRYHVEVKNPQGYAFYSANLDTDAEKNNVAIGLLALRPNAKLLLRDITFEYNSFELTDDSHSELDRVIKLMYQNPTLVIEIAAHTDNIGSAVFNKKLSERRARYVADYMAARNVAEERCKPVGYGKDMPIVPNDTEANRAKNRRLELKVLSINK